MLSDQGTEYNNQVIECLTKNVGIEHKVTSANHPRTNGLTERMNGELVNTLAKFTTREMA